MFDINFISKPGIQNETSDANWSFLDKKNSLSNIHCKLQLPFFSYPCITSIDPVAGSYLTLIVNSIGNTFPSFNEIGSIPSTAP